MRIQNKLPDMRNGSVKVKGTTVQCDSNGIAEVSEEIASILLRNKDAWKPLIVRKPIESISETPTLEIDFDLMTKTQLVEYATNEGIIVDSKSKKQEIVNIIISKKR